MGKAFERRVVAVTGASAGVGRAIVRAFAARGAHIGLIARGIDGLEAAKREVEEMGGRALVLPLAGAVEAAAELIERELGPIDIWINDAMVAVFAPVSETTPAEYKRVTEVTYLGYVHGTLAALKRMKRRDRGKIIQIGSALAYRSIPLHSASCAAKHAVRGFTESLRLELRHERSKVRVTEVLLPAVNTPQFSWSRSKLPRQPQPLPPIFQPEVVADAVVFAADHDRREVWVGWPTVKAVMSERVAPGVGDRYLARSVYEKQETLKRANPRRRDNLYDPVPGDHGAHGRFDDRALDRSLEWSIAKHKYVALGLGALGLVLAMTGLRLRSR